MQNQSYWLRNSTGHLVHNIIADGTARTEGAETWLAWDFSRGAGAVYAKQCLRMVTSGVIDGIFSDGCARTPYPLTNKTQEAYARNKVATLTTLQGQIPGYFVCASTGTFSPGLNASELQNSGKIIG